MDDETKLLILETENESLRSKEVDELIAKFESDLNCLSVLAKNWGKQ